MTVLQAVDDAQITELRREPGGILQLSAKPSYVTSFGPSVNYFLTGSAYPDGHPLAVVLEGAERSTAADLSAARSAWFEHRRQRH